ncbi:hypothetical protein AMTRI_Chr07g76970 [Amborella trichopoda]
MAANCCRGCIAFLLKFLNFFQTFVGVSIILYSVWMINQWNDRAHVPAPFAPIPENLNPSVLSLYDSRIRDSNGGIHNHELLDIQRIELSGHGLSRKLGGISFNQYAGINFETLPAPWFIYSFMGIGILLCLITCIGHIAAEALNGCCLCSYTTLTTILILVEAALVGDILFNDHWDKDLPYDPTGEFDTLKSFVEDNIEICQWVGLTLICIQALSLLLALILRAMVSTRWVDYDSDDDYGVGRINYQQPFLNHQGGQNSTLISGDIKNIRTDAWSARMREKYGLNPNEFAYNSIEASTGMRNGEENQGRCIIM